MFLEQNRNLFCSSKVFLFALLSVSFYLRTKPHELRESGEKNSHLSISPSVMVGDQSQNGFESSSGAAASRLCGISTHNGECLSGRYHNRMVGVEVRSGKAWNKMEG